MKKLYPIIILALSTSLNSYAINPKSSQEPIPSSMVSVPKKEIVHEYNIISSMPKEKQYAIFTAAMISLTENPDSARNILNKMQDPYVRPRNLFSPADVSNAKTNNIGEEIPVAFVSIADVGSSSKVTLPDSATINHFWFYHDIAITDRSNWYKGFINWRMDLDEKSNRIMLMSSEESYRALAKIWPQSRELRNCYARLMSMAQSKDPLSCAAAYGYHLGLQELTSPDYLYLRPTIPCLDWYQYVKNNNIRTLPNQ